MNAAYYARHARAVELAGLERSLTPREVSILLVVSESLQLSDALPVDRLSPLLGLETHPAAELRALSWAGLVEVSETRDGSKVTLTERGQKIATELRAHISDQLMRWVTRIRMAA